MEISGKVFVVTGAAGGIGREVVLQLLARGGRVAALDLSAERLEELERTADAGDRLSVHAVDVTDATAAQTLPTRVAQAHGQVDGLLNIAGIVQPFRTVAELDRSTFEKVMNVNFWGPVNLVQAFLPELLRRPSAAIVNVSSMGGFVPVPGQTVYGASKAAVKLFTEGLHAELRGTPVAVTVVFPGGVATSITQNSGVDVPVMAAAVGTSSKPPRVPRTTSAPDAARAIVRGLERGSYRVLIGRDAQSMDALVRLSPRRAMATIANQMASLLQH